MCYGDQLIHEKMLKDQLSHIVTKSIVEWQQTLRKEFHLAYLRRQLQLPMTADFGQKGDIMSET